MKTHSICPPRLWLLLGTALGLSLFGPSPLLADNDHHERDHDNDGRRGESERRLQVVSPQRKIAGKSYADWGVEWYRWDLGNPTSKASSLDPTGANNSVGQDGPVWFLAGSSTGGAVERTVTVPQGKYLFFPLINIINDYPCPDSSFQPAPGQSLEDFLGTFAKAVIDTTTDLSAELDGRPVPNLQQYRATSGLFEFEADLSWSAFDPCINGQPQPAVADGYWLMLEPPSLGNHTIVIRGKDFIPGTPPTPFGDQNVTLHVKVVPPAEVAPPRSRPYGKSYGEWQAKWWQWAISIPAPEGSNHPQFDQTGENASVGQDGPVWFLIFNASGTATREIVVPEGKSLFFPAVNVECSTIEAAPFYGANEAELRSCVRQWRRKATYCEIDGRPVADIGDFDSESPAFTFDAPDHNILTGGAAASGLSVSAGTHIFVPPLCEGEHTIRFGGSQSHPTAGGFSVDQVYRIRVVRPARVLAPNAKVAGKGIEDYAGLWWKWGIETTADKVPILDETGALGADRQSGPVWFLAGNFGGTTVRTLKVPRGKYLFFPVINSAPWIQVAGVDPDISPECVADNYECIRSQIRPVPNFPTAVCEIDGRPVSDIRDYYEESSPFTFELPPDNLAGLPAGNYFPCVDNGFYVMVPPLSRGNHTIHIRGRANAPGFSLDVTYHLTIQ